MEYPVSTKINGNKVALMADIHSNYPAFQACYEDAVNCGADSFVFLGDYVSDLAQPQQTMDLLYRICDTYPTVCLLGNRERYMLEHANGSSDFSRGSKSGSLLFTYEHLRQKDLDFFRRLRISDTIAFHGIPVEIAHASMGNDRYYFDSTDGHTTEIFPQMYYPYLLTAHSHRQYILCQGNKTIINPGSVGIPHGGTIHAKYAFLTTEGQEISCTLREVPYAIESTIHAQFAEGLVDYAKYWAIAILYDSMTGKECTLSLLHRVQEMGDIFSEEDWHTVATALGMKFTEEEILDFYRKTCKHIKENTPCPERKK